MVRNLKGSLLNGKYRRNLESFYIPRSSLPPSDEMAFIDIEDPARRKEIVKEYVQMRNEVRQRGEDNKESNLLRQQTIQESTRPLVEATERSAKLITSALKPELTPESIALFNRYATATKNKDKYFSIYRN